MAEQTVQQFDDKTLRLARGTDDGNWYVIWGRHYIRCNDYGVAREMFDELDAHIGKSMKSLAEQTAFINRAESG